MNADSSDGNAVERSKNSDSVNDNEAITLKLAGCAKASVLVDSLNVTVQQLKEAIAATLGCDAAPLKLILGGKRLQDGARQLKDHGVSPIKPILVLGAATSSQQQAALGTQEHQAAKQQSREERLTRLRNAAKALAQRSGSSSVGNEEFHDLSLETQSGQQVVLSDTDREALVMGMTLHDKAQQLLNKEAYRQALDVLLLAEESFQCCKNDLLRYVDNQGLLFMDIVWCFFQLREEQSLAAAQQRLARARQCLERSHGPGLERIKVLHGNFCPELATYVRLELLEGVAAYYSGDRGMARARLKASQERWQQLQVSDERLVELLSMGFDTQEAKRGLRFCQGNTENAVTFIMEQRRAEEERSQRAREEKRLRRERRGYGRTCRGEIVNMDSLAALSGLGYSRPLVAEALKQADNDMQGALDLLSTPAGNTALQQAVLARTATAHLTPDKTPTQLQQAGRTAGQEQGNAAAMGAGASSDDGQQPTTQDAPSTSHGPERDAEAEQELTDAARSDPFAAYDVEVTLEGQAIREYLGMLGDLDAAV